MLSHFTKKVEIVIISTMDVRVSLEGDTLTDNERKILDVLMLNLSAFANANVTGEGMAINQLTLEENEVFNQRLGWPNLSLQKMQKN